MEKYTVVVRQKRFLFWWVRDRKQAPIFCVTPIFAAQVANDRNDSLLIARSKNRKRYIVISIDKV